MRGQTVDDLIAELQALPAYARRRPVALRITDDTSDGTVTVDAGDNGYTVLLQSADECAGYPDQEAD